MGKALYLIFCLWLACCSAAPLAAEDKFNQLFDAYGFLSFTLFPPRNRQDLNLRGYTPMWATGQAYDWYGDAFPRYGLETSLTLEIKRYNKVFISFNPYVPMGQTIPQVDYGWSFKPIGVRIHYEIGYHLTDRLDILYQHHNLKSFGKHRNLIVPEGPYGLWNGITTRYRFDTRKH